MSQAAKTVQGVKDCKADYNKGVAQVTFAPSQTSADKIARVIAEKTGYKVTLPPKAKK